MRADTQARSEILAASAQSASWRRTPSWPHLTAKLAECERERNEYKSLADLAGHLKECEANEQRLREKYALCSTCDELRAEVARLKDENAVLRVDSANVVRMHDELAALRAVVEKAPHANGCEWFWQVQGGHKKSCNCWKRDALGR